MKHFLLIIFISLISVTAYSNATSDLLDKLKSEINKKSEYDKNKELRIKSLKAQQTKLSKTDYDGQFDVLNNLYNEYKSYHSDSAYVYAHKMIAVSLITGNKTQQHYGYVKLAYILLSSGMFMETLDLLHNVDLNALSNQNKVDYYLSLSRCNYELANYSDDNHFSPVYVQAANKYMDSAILFCGKEEINRAYLLGLQKMQHNNFNESRFQFENLLNHDKPISMHISSMASSSIAAVCLANAERKEGLDLMIHAVISDIKSSTKETVSLYTLAQLLYQEGNIDDAYNLIKLAKADADFYGARQRKLQIGKILPLISEAKLGHLEHQKNKFWVYLLVLAALVLLGLFVFLILVKRLRKIKDRQHKISADNLQLSQINGQLIKDAKINVEYLGQFFKIISDYISKLENLKFSLKIKPAANRNEIIYDLINNLNIKKEREKMYFNFDHIFTQLFPNFITVFNSMFDEKDQIWPVKDQTLNTDLRIFALIRMGITDNETIAKILEYSDSTIYVYKMKIKAKSHCPDQFEQRIMNIKVTDFN
ncbi:DUF6377 domain-containing protein [Mucilaginibacter lappiensis]|uniref:DUF6377 domain-containing protein n=1 Tax=Mucilaginibacter lappiensis TaxID=354630 RepID=UPI003D1B4906